MLKTPLKHPNSCYNIKAGKVKYSFKYAVSRLKGEHKKQYWPGRKERRRLLANKRSKENGNIPKNKYNSYKSSAKAKSLEFKLTFNVFKKLISQPCAYCGSTSKIGVDRLDNKKGYTLENSIPCCTTCNMMKRDYTAEEFINKCKDVAVYLSSSTHKT